MTNHDLAGKLVEWYQEHRRELPWRNTNDPYKIWLSEIILQQTRVAQGLPYYKSFIKAYPKLPQLAKAPERDILRLWQGLGYYSRARNLHACAKTVWKDYQGKFPNSFDGLRQLKGIGDYTAAAIASFAYNERVAVLDGNVFRVLARVFGLHHDIRSTQGKKRFAALANGLLPEKEPGTYNQAIMEFGALHCTPRNPKCSSCPIQQSCVAFKQDLQEVLPVKSKLAKPTRRIFYYVVIRSGSRVAMKQRGVGDIWSGLFDFPMLESKSRLTKIRLARWLSNELSRRAPEIQITGEYKQVLSHQVIHARFVELEWTSMKLPAKPIFDDVRFYSPSQVVKLPKSVLISRYLDDRRYPRELVNLHPGAVKRRT